MHRVKNFIKNMDKNMKLAIVAVIGVIVVGALIYGNSNPSFSLSSILSKIGFGSSGKELAQKAVDYINNEGLSQTPATVSGDVTEESGVFKFKIKIGSNEFDSYVTKDGKLLFPQVFVMETKKTDAGDKQGDTAGTEGKTAEEVIASIKKSDKPMLEAYVVARCPFGLQMQRIMAEALKGAPALDQYMKVRYMGSVSSDGKTITAMHGEAEAAENLRQICIREEQPAKYWSYVSCQMKAANTEVTCEKSTGVDSAKLQACISDTSRGVAFAKADFELQNKYNVTGSPTMVLNDAELAEFDSNSKPIFGGRSADAIKTMVCNGFNAQPGFCSTKLNTEQGAGSFSPTYSNTSASANANSAAGCEPAQ